ncbi:MAG: universal stress protein [Hyphomicrobiales bacterium]|nr:universal stress protein [Hyphomicrobiales bacterium]MCP5374069.1 universal stress protein [Hyphomicrobiales bacterium]
MSDETTNESAEGETPGHLFLVIVDESEELSQALFYACRSSVRIGGRVALLKVVEPAEFQHWIGVGELMRAEARDEAEELLQSVAAVVHGRTGTMPVIFIREGEVEEQVVELLREEPNIAALVLGAASGDQGPGPLVSGLISRLSGQLPVPIIVVPGSLTQDEIQAIT